jgi:serpin B
MRTIIALCVGLLALSFPIPAHAQKLDPDVEALVQGNSDFGLTLFQRLAQKPGNVFFSPYSISNAFGMCYAGARGNTAAEMKTTLRFNLAEDRLHPAFRKLIADLDGAGKKRPFQLTVANRLWGQKDYGFQPEFIKIGKDDYGAGLEEVDFMTASEDARQTINAWVEKQTGDKIKDLIPRGVLNSDSRLVLTNAIYFKAAWSTPFNPKMTKPGPFFAGDKKVETPMMRQSQRTKFGDFGSFTMLQLPYEKYEQSMLILLPKKKDLAVVEAELTAANVAAWVKKLSDHRVDVMLPKFKVTAMFRLDDILKEMGMKDAFARSKADFSGMASREKLFITAVLHKAFVDVNEAGTEAAAATAIAIGTTSAPPPATFHADHPFLFLIRDHRTGSILFVGRVENPSAS